MYVLTHCYRNPFYRYGLYTETIKGVRMRRRLLGVLGVGTAAVMMLSGFDSAMTVADLEKNAVEAMKTVEQFSGDFNAGADITVTVTQEGENGATMSLPLSGELTGSFCMTMEPSCMLSKMKTAQVQAMSMLSPEKTIPDGKHQRFRLMRWRR